MLVIWVSCHQLQIMSPCAGFSYEVLHEKLGLPILDSEKTKVAPYFICEVVVPLVYIETVPMEEEISYETAF